MASVAEIDGLTVTPFTGLLDTYTGAVAGYSMRRLASSATNLMRIREDSGDTETDIGYDSNGDLDTAAIATHCGTANGYVVTWYDQSGNSNHATQSTASYQPIIYNGTAVYTENGKPIIQNEAGSLKRNALDVSSINFSTDNWAFGVCLVDRTFSNWVMGPTANDFVGLAQSGSSLSAHSITGVTLYKDGTSWSAPLRRDWYTDLLNNQSLVVGNWSSSTWTGFSLGYPFSDSIFIHPMQEFILWTTDPGNRSGIESNINGFFSIYP